MRKKDLRNLVPAVEAGDIADHVAKCRAILDRTPHNRSSVQWPENDNNATRDEAFAMAGKRMKPGCITCHLEVIDYLRKQVGLHSLKVEVEPGEYRRRLNHCRGNKSKGIPKCEHLAFTQMNCGLCLCFIDAKAWFKNQQCPAGKWART